MLVYLTARCVIWRGSVTTYYINVNDTTKCQHSGNEKFWRTWPKRGEWPLEINFDNNLTKAIFIYIYSLLLPLQTNPEETPLLSTSIYCCIFSAKILTWIFMRISRNYLLGGVGYFSAKLFVIYASYMS